MEHSIFNDSDLLQPTNSKQQPAFTIERMERVIDYSSVFFNEYINVCLLLVNAKKTITFLLSHHKTEYNKSGN